MAGPRARLRLLARHVAPAAGSQPFKMVFLGGGGNVDRIVEDLAAHSPDSLTVVVTERDGYEARHELADADGAYGTLTPELLAAAPNLQWLQCPAAAPVGDYYFDELVASDVTVTNMRGIYDEELSIHMLTLMLAVNRQLPAYHSLQLRHEYTKLPSGGDNPADGGGAAGVDIPSSTALLVGVGNAGGETARLCKALGMRTLGVDARRTDPHPSVDELHPAEGASPLRPREAVRLSSGHSRPKRLLRRSAGRAVAAGRFCPADDPSHAGDGGSVRCVEVRPDEILGRLLQRRTRARPQGPQSAQLPAPPPRVPTSHLLAGRLWLGSASVSAEFSASALTSARS
eukprot:COSAG04_NODE_1660_length_6022_cov_5.271146_5_plen_343_part_00